MLGHLWATLSLGFTSFLGETLDICFELLLLWVVSLVRWSFSVCQWNGRRNCSSCWDQSVIQHTRHHLSVGLWVGVKDKALMKRFRDYRKGNLTCSSSWGARTVLPVNPHVATNVLLSMWVITGNLREGTEWSLILFFLFFHPFELCVWDEYQLLCQC